MLEYKYLINTLIYLTKSEYYHIYIKYMKEIKCTFDNYNVDLYNYKNKDK